MSALFGRSFGDGLSAGTKAVAEATSAKILPDSDKVAKDRLIQLRQWHAEKPHYHPQTTTG
jgi:hypothetical protein